MSRIARKQSSTSIYHVVIRGINQQRLFEEDADFIQFLSILREVKSISGFSLFAYCLMGNHVHLLIEEGAEPLSQVFKRLGARYVSWFNWKYQRHGHLFEDRFKSEPVEDDAYFSCVIAYIHNNPLKAGLCTAAKRYPWSSLALLAKRDPLIDWEHLEELIPLDDLALVNEPAADRQPLSADTQRRQAFSDEQAQRLLASLCGAQNTAAFQKLEKDIQRIIYPKLREKGMPIRQVARITGTSKGVVERWGAKKEDR